MEGGQTGAHRTRRARLRTAPPWTRPKNSYQSFLDLEGSCDAFGQYLKAERRPLSRVPGDVMSHEANVSLGSAIEAHLLDAASIASHGILRAEHHIGGGICAALAMGEFVAGALICESYASGHGLTGSLAFAAISQGPNAVPLLQRGLACDN